MLSELTSEALVNLNIEASDWQDAIRKAAQPLVKEKKIQPCYIDNIIRAVKEVGPYILITKHVALPHARPEEGALQSAIGIATLKTPIKFGNKDNDPVKYLFTLSAKDNDSHLSALADLAELLENKDFYDVLDKAQHPEEVINFIKKGWK